MATKFEGRGFTLLWARENKSLPTRRQRPELFSVCVRGRSAVVRKVIWRMVDVKQGAQAAVKKRIKSFAFYEIDE
jgi:hypothetical protein